MMFNELLEEYLLDKIDSDTLYACVKRYFGELFNECKFRELEYLKIYPFISEMQDEDLYYDCILQKKIKDINLILNGQQEFAYDLWVGLEGCDMSLMIKILDEYKEKGVISFGESELLEEKRLKISLNTKTIEDICWEKLLSILVGLPTTDDNFGVYNLLYTKEVDNISLCEEVERLIEILEGKRPLHISLRYRYAECMYTIL